MRQRIAIKSLAHIYRDSLSIKREALMFDQIVIPDFYFYQRLADTIGQGDMLLSELEWLAEQQIVALSENDAVDTLILGYSDEESKRGGLGELLKAADNLDRLLPYLDQVPSTLQFMDVFQSVNNQLADHRVRAFSKAFTHFPDTHAVSILSNKLQPVEFTSTTTSDITEITFNALPIPDESVSWEQIIDFRNDPGSRSKFLGLVNWMNEIARVEMPHAELEEKVEYLIHEYTEHMKLHRMKINTGMLETVVTTAAEVVGDLVSLKWGHAARALFSLNHRKIALLEAERAAPGREIAYIVRAKEAFGE
jgi:hypothetical protein